MRDKKGAIFSDLILLLIVFFVAILFFVVFIYGYGLITARMVEFASNNDANLPGNITNAVDSTFVAINKSLPTLQWVALAIFFGMTIAIFISNFLVRAHPVFFLPYILFVTFAVIFAIYISNAYTDLLSNPVIGVTLQSWTFTAFIMQFLPIWISIIGIAGGVFLFIGSIVDKEQGGGLQ